MITQDQFKQACEICSKEGWKPLTEDPVLNWMIDCLTDEYMPYDEQLYKEEVVAWKAGETN